MRQEQITRSDRAKQARHSERRRSQRTETAEVGAGKQGLRGGGAPGADVDEELLRRISLLIDASANAAARA